MESSATARRVRRSPEEARRVILDAAEKRLTATGPSGLRLGDVASDVGVSHPAVLHHFGSREELLLAVVNRSVRKLGGRMLQALETADVNEPAGAIITDVFRTLSDSGQARLLAWIIMDPQYAASATGGTLLQDIISAVHARRRQVGGAPPSHRETTFLVLLAAMTAIGDGVAGDTLRESAGLGGDDTWVPEFREWFASLLHDRLQGDR